MNYKKYDHNPNVFLLRFVDYTDKFDNKMFLLQKIKNNKKNRGGEKQKQQKQKQNN